MVSSTLFRYPRSARSAEVLTHERAFESFASPFRESEPRRHAANCDDCREVIMGDRYVSHSFFFANASSSVILEMYTVP
jgi:hypothetical protein